MTYEIKLPQFEGPFDLLLFFIERDELDIHEISISKITDEFLTYVQQMSELNIEIASEFILVAATLMRIKARLLLPRTSHNAEGDEIDPRTQLVERLLEYRRFKETIPFFIAMEEERQQYQKRGNIQADLDHLSKQSLPNEEFENLTLYQLLRCYSRVLERNIGLPKEAPHTVVQHPYSIEKQKEEILALIKINETLNFAHLSSQSKDKLQLVYNFLAILELLQQEILDIELGLGFNNFWVSARQNNSRGMPTVND